MTWTLTQTNRLKGRCLGRAGKRGDNKGAPLDQHTQVGGGVVEVEELGGPFSQAKMGGRRGQSIQLGKGILKHGYNPFYLQRFSFQSTFLIW